jgi:lysine N6-hydroxylase
VHGVDHDGQSFVVHGSGGSLRTKNVVLGVGKQPLIPPCAAPLVSEKVFHSSTFASRDAQSFVGKDVLLVGGGQSASEIAMQLMSDVDRLPLRLVWITARTGFQPIDDSPFH